MTEVINVISLVASRTREPVVQVSWGEQSGQLDVHDARELAFSLLRAADAAESDAFLIRFLDKKVGIEEGGVITVLNEFRQYRTEVEAETHVEPDMEPYGNE